MAKDTEPKKPLRVSDLVHRPDQASKPSELIQIKGHEALSLNARRAITILWHSAHKQGVEAGKDYAIEMNELVPTSHKGTDSAVDAVLQLMQTLLKIRLPNGTTDVVQIVGGSNIGREDRPPGMLIYSFDKRLVAVLKESLIWGKIDMAVLMSLSSKYAISFYENMAQLANLDHKTSQEFSLDDFRAMLGIEKKKYLRFSELNQHILKSVVAEINALAAFNIGVMPIKTGRVTTRIHVNWWPKLIEERKAAWSELQNTRVGRKARISDQVEMVFPVSPSPLTLARQSKKKQPKP